MKKIVSFLVKVLVVIIVVLLVCYIKNLIILNGLKSKSNENSRIDNYYTKSISYEQDLTTVTEKYYKGGKKLEIVDYYKYTKEILSKTNYTDNETNIVILEKNGEKVAKIEEINLVKETIYNIFENKNLFSLAFQNITSDKVNQKECYIFEIEDTDYFVEKETGLIIRIIKEGQIIDNYYELGNVSDEKVQKPDITEYQIIQ